MDAPLLNRFEKHYYNDFDNLSTEEKQIINDLINWMNTSSNYLHFNINDMYPVLTYNED